MEDEEGVLSDPCLSLEWEDDSEADGEDSIFIVLVGMARFPLKSVGRSYTFFASLENRRTLSLCNLAALHKWRSKMLIVCGFSLVSSELKYYLPNEYSNGN